MSRESLASVEQDNWREVSQAIYAALLRIAMRSDLLPDEVVMLIKAASDAQTMQINALCFDDRVEGFRNKCGHFHGCGE